MLTMLHALRDHDTAQVPSHRSSGAPRRIGVAQTPCLASVAIVLLRRGLGVGASMPDSLVQVVAVCAVADPS